MVKAPYQWRVRYPSWLHTFLMEHDKEKLPLTTERDLWCHLTTVIYIHTQPHKLIHCTNQTTHINTLSHTLKPPKAAMWWLYRVSCFSPLPHNPSVSHNRKLKERVAVPRAPRLFDLCEPLSLMKISAVLWTTGAADRGATCSPHNSQRLPTSERCNRPAGEDAGWGGGRELERGVKEAWRCRECTIPL